MDFCQMLRPDTLFTTPSSLTGLTGQDDCGNFSYNCPSYAIVISDTKFKRVEKMRDQNVQHQGLIEKIRSLPPEKIEEVEDFVDFLGHRSKDRLLTNAATKLSENAFGKVWSNPEDDDYDRL